MYSQPFSKVEGKKIEELFGIQEIRKINAIVKRMKKTCRREQVAFPQLCPSFEPFFLLSAAHKLTSLLGVCFRFTCINE